MTVETEPFLVTSGLLLGVGGVAFLLGLVVDLSLRGYGFVPGTGGAGQTNPEHLDESRGFYWRT